MSNKSYCLRMICDGMRGVFANTRDIVDQANIKHTLSPLAAAALGRTLTAALLLVTDNKNNEEIMLKIDGDGGLGRIIAEARPSGIVRGYLDNPKFDLSAINGKLPVGKGVGNGKLSVTRFTGLKDAITGICDITTGEIGEDIAEYLKTSQQTASAVSLGVKINKKSNIIAAGGYIVEALPDCSEWQMEKTANNIAKLPALTEMLEQGINMHDIARNVWENCGEISLLDEKEWRYYCNCSREKVLNTLAALGSSDISDLYRDESLEVICNYCGTRYEILQNDLAVIIDSRKKAD